MKRKELERHTRKLLLKLGLSDYEAVMTTVIKAIARLDATKTNRFKALQDILVSLQPDPKNNDVHPELVERLAIVMMLLVARKFHKIHTGSD